MNLLKAVPGWALALVLAACGSGESDNVMSAEANVLEPVDVNAALGPEVGNTSDLNMAANATNGTDNGVQPDEPATNTANE